MIRRLLAPLLLAAVPGCLTPSDSPLQGPPPIPTDHTIAADFVAAYALTLNERDLPAYVALLEQPSGEAPGATFSADFTDTDLGDFPWIPDGWAPLTWDFHTEVTLVGNLFDAEYFGEEKPVESIDARIDIVEETEQDEHRLLDTAALILVRTIHGEEWRARSRLQFLLVPDDHGYLRIRELRESDAVIAFPHVLSWAGIRWRYEPGLP